MEKVHEKVSTIKVAEKIKDDGFQAGRKAIQEVVKTLTERGFEEKEILPFVREGVKKAYKELPNK